MKDIIMTTVKKKTDVSYAGTDSLISFKGSNSLINMHYDNSGDLLLECHTRDIAYSGLFLKDNMDPLIYRELTILYNDLISDPKYRKGISSKTTVTNKGVLILSDECAFIDSRITFNVLNIRKVSEGFEFSFINNSESPWTFIKLNTNRSHNKYLVMRIMKFFNNVVNILDENYQLNFDDVKTLKKK